MVLFIVAFLSFAGFRGVYSYRGLLKGLSARAAELPKATKLVTSIVELRLSWVRLNEERSNEARSPVPQVDFSDEDREDFISWLGIVEADLDSYREQLEQVDESSYGVGTFITDKVHERKKVQEIQASIERINKLFYAHDHIFTDKLAIGQDS